MRPSPLGLPDPLARLHGTAAHLGITVLAGEGTGWWPDAAAAAIVSSGERITLGPGLSDDDLQADVLAMALIVAAVMGDRATGHPCAITAPAGFVVISRTRVPRPAPGPGKLATMLARTCGRDVASAAFEYTAPHERDGAWRPWLTSAYGERLAPISRTAGAEAPPEACLSIHRA